MDPRIAQLELHHNDQPLSVDRLACEQQAALRDLLTLSHFRPLNDNGGPYAVKLAVADARLVVAIRNAKEEDLSTLVLSLRPYRKVIDDYFLMIRSFEEARHTASPAKLEAIDMGRRGLHNEGAELLVSRFADKVEIDFETARRLFTLICALHRDQIRTMG
ncbi:MAG: UPF0262 family protein [Alphaproteobacteria bacterium]|nr:UPF0262 family protein [Alphaproteobacteria bacterium]